MNKLIASYVLVFICFSYFSSVIEGGGGLVTTQLSANINDSATTITVDSTVGFLEADSIVINGEDIAYTGTTANQFTGCERGVHNTDADNHADNTKVYAPGSGVLNRALGFNVASTGEDIGTLAVVTIAIRFLTQAVGHLVTFNFGMLTGQLVYLRYLLMAPAVGFIIYLGFMALSTAFGVLRR